MTKKICKLIGLTTDSIVLNTLYFIRKRKFFRKNIWNIIIWKNLIINSISLLVKKLNFYKMKMRRFQKKI